SAPPADGAGDCSHWECSIAIETDHQLFQLFGDLGAESGYVAALLAAVSSRYEEQIDTLLVFPYVQFYTSAADPWDTPDTGGDSLAMLYELQDAWLGAVPAGARLGHLISGADLGGGIAWLGVLGDDSQTYTFAVSGNLDGGTPFPVAVGPLNWDFMVTAHETGHNFNSPHTHDFVPPIDECAFDICIPDGTIMSYCHLCAGGMSNITTWFHPLCVDLMQLHAGDFLPLDAPLVAAPAGQPTLVPPFTATPLTVEVQGAPVGPVQLNWRHSPSASFASKPMAEQGGGLWSATLPAPQCGSSPEWYFSMNDASCGAVQTQSFAAEVGNATTLLHDDLELDTGWAAGAPGDDATSGVWVRGDPIGTGAQPEADLTEAGTDCWFTGQGSVGGGDGENDVDDGRTTLTTPPIDLSSGDARIAYWRWYSNDGGGDPNADVFTVDISNDGAAWVNVETVGPAGEGTGGLWFRHELLVSDFVAPGPGVQLRFVASDEDGGSLVEAAIDELEVFRVECGAHCQAQLGFGGPGTSSLSVCGGNLSSGTSATLSLTGATPGGTAFLFAGLSFGPTPTKGGVLVPVPPMFKIGLPLNGSGAVSTNLPGGGGPVSVYVQAVYQQPALPAPHWGFSNAVRVDLLP
ncbi:MAG TPA: M12 family metallo-peptidase, partial [Planctomycetota bacterium]|nr:M12 family metallo-peptidase [Planctomycetota bacterium]